nr:MAG TPA: hypothetical protein [Caudoviricetes sp.]
MFCKPIIPSIPAVYRSALDYASQLCMLSSEVQRVAQEIETLTAVTEDEVVAYVAQQLDPVKAQLQALRNSTDSRFAAQAAQIAQHVTELELYVNNQAAQVYSNSVSVTNDAWQQLNERIDDTLEQGGLVRSPISGSIVTVQVALNELASLHRNGLTAQDFDNLLLTAQAFDDKNLTAYDFDYTGVTA